MTPRLAAVVASIAVIVLATEARTAAQLGLGCTIEDGTVTVPSMERQVGDERDVFKTRIALPGAMLRDRPSGAATAIAKLDWHVLTLARPWNGGSWLAVRLDDGRAGHVYEPMTRSPIDYRAWFHQRKGRWLMAGFLSGD